LLIVTTTPVLVPQFSVAAFRPPTKNTPSVVPPTIRPRVCHIFRRGIGSASIFATSSIRWLILLGPLLYLIGSSFDLG
jgi:hypothetical protein